MFDNSSANQGFYFIDSCEGTGNIVHSIAQGATVTIAASRFAQAPCMLTVAWDAKMEENLSQAYVHPHGKCTAVNMTECE